LLYKVLVGVRSFRRLRIFDDRVKARLRRVAYDSSVQRQVFSRECTEKRRSPAQLPCAREQRGRCRRFYCYDDDI